jgi:peptidoglycan/LPS O-acetylase OafA/YrhL
MATGTSPAGADLDTAVAAAPDIAVIERPDSADRPAGESSRMPYNPAFDGIRGLAVAAVLLFHHGVSWMRGGYLGVSTFFTLSGFLITTLLLTERAVTGTVRLPRFWARRVRRLLPASSLTLVGVVVLAAFVDQPWERSLRGDVFASLFQVANWRFLFDHRSYGELFADPSPVLHFWSLAIEEQFYWVFPLVTVGLLRLAKGSHRTYGMVLAAAIAGSALLTFALGSDNQDAVYYGTFTRMAEILAGALLATVLFEEKWLESNHFSSKNAGRGWALLGLAALGASAFAWVTVAQTDAGLYRGGLLVYAAISVALVAAAARSPQLQRLLGWRPLRALGIVSYGAYLFHWPIYLVLDSDRTGLDAGGWALGALRIGVTLLLAGLSFARLEQPVRRGRWPTGRFRPVPVWAGGAVATVVLVTLVVPVISPPAPLDPFIEAQRRDAARIAALPPEAPRLLFFGDSASLMISAGVSEWGIHNDRLGVVGGSAQLGCGIARGGEVRQFGSAGPMPGGGVCDWSTQWPKDIDAHADAHPSVAVIMTGTWDVVDHKLPDDDTWRGPGDPVFDQRLRAELADATELLLAQGLTVVWLTTPPLDFGRGMDPRPALDPPDAPARIDRLNELIHEVADARTGVGVVDLHGYFAGLSQAQDNRLRPDGVHVEMSTSEEVAEWLGPQILDAAAAAGSVSGS